MSISLQRDSLNDFWSVKPRDTMVDEISIDGSGSKGDGTSEEPPPFVPGGKPVGEGGYVEGEISEEVPGMILRKDSPTRQTMIGARETNHPKNHVT